jgi:hypothetical protein
MIRASEFRKKEALLTVDDKPGYYKWWAKRPELDILLNGLDVSFGEVEQALEQKEGMFCIYVGIAVKESVRDRLNWHVNDPHTATQVKYGTLSTFRQSLSSIIAHDQYDKASTDAFIDKLYAEWFYSGHPVKSEEAKVELHDIERNMLSEHLRLLNIQENKHPLAKPIRQKLSALRTASK